VRDPPPKGIRLAVLWPLAGILVTLAALPLVGLLLIQGMLRGCSAELGEALGEALVKAIPTFSFPDDRTPDLEIAAGEPGYLASIRLAGPQMHFGDEDGSRTCVASKIWFGDKHARMTVALYGGPPSRDIAPESVQPWSLPVLVLRVVGSDGSPRDGARVWCLIPGFEGPQGPALAEHGALNLAAPFGGTLTLWMEGGPKCEIEMEALERVWATLGPAGLVIDAREGR
jgi:hypothetical protein